MASPKDIEAAEAVNCLLQLSARDHESLLAVAMDYFTSPSSQEDDSDLEDETGMELDVEPGTYIHTHTNTFINRIAMVHTFIFIFNTGV